MARCLISFGANIGDARATILSASARLSELLCDGPLGNAGLETGEPPFQLSRCFRTPPVGGPAGQPPFINAVAAIRTPASPWDVWHCIRTVEKEFGRQRNLRWEARRIDLDILLYDDQRIWTPHLKIPHPRMCMRRFIVLPAVDVAPHWIDPVTGWTINQLAANLREGPSNLTLIAADENKPENKPESLLVEVAQRTGARWRTQHAEVVQDDASSGRWVSPRDGTFWMKASCDAQEPVTSLGHGKLLVVLAPRQRVPEVAWEDYHRSLAVRLGLQARLDAPPDATGLVACETDAQLPWSGPRYLLASDDRDWAMQELVAALEAMDCPIEVA